MEGVFRSASSITEFHFAQESQRALSDTNFLNAGGSETRSPISNKRSLLQFGDMTPKQYSMTSILNHRASIESDQPNISLNPPHRYNFITNLGQMKTMIERNKENINETALQIANQEKNTLNIVAQQLEDPKPAAMTQRDLNTRSKTPMSFSSKGSVTSRAKTPNLRLSVIFESKINGQLPTEQRSPHTTRYQTSSNSDRYFQLSTRRIIEKSSEKRPTSALRTNSSNRTSTLKLSRSRLGDSPPRSFISTTTPSKRSSRIDTLRKIKFTESPNASSAAKMGINIVKETLEDAMEEKENWRVKVEELRKAVKEERTSLDKTQDNIRYMATCLGRLTKRNENLDRSTMNTQTLITRTHEDINRMQEEVYAFVDKIRNLNRQIEAEAKQLKHYKQLTITLKEKLAEQAKDKDTIRSHLQVSKHTRNKSSERLYVAAQTHRNFVAVLEDQFQKYAA